MSLLLISSFQIRDDSWREGEKNEWRGGWWKVLGCIQSQYAAFCVAFKVTQMDTGREISLFLFRINFPFIVFLKLETWKHCSSRQFAHNLFFFFNLCLGSEPISGSALVVEDRVQKWFSTFRVFYFQRSSFQVTISPQKFFPYPEQCVKDKLNPFTEMIPGIDAVKLYSNYFMSHHYVYLMS